MFVRNKRFGIFSKSFLNKPALSPTWMHRTKLLIQVERRIEGVGVCSRLVNDYIPGTDIHKYQKDSWKKLLNNLLPNHLNIYVHAGRFSNNKNIMVAGHVASFVTDNNANIVNDTVMSLRNGELARDENNKTIKVEGVLNGKLQPEYLYKVEFVSMETEFCDFFFKKAGSTYGLSRHLISIPIGEEDILLIKEFVARSIELYGNQHYQMFDGIVQDEFRKALNCCLGFYSGLGVVGRRINPSPQLVAWSYLKFIFEERIRKKLIEGSLLDDKYLTGAELRDALLKESGLKENSVIREDDVLTPVNRKF